MKSILKLVASVTMSLALLSHIGLVNAEIAPDVLVKQTADDVLTIIKNDKDIQAGDKGKIYALAEEKILPNFDFDRVCRMVLGKNWRSATPEQQESFQKEFRSLLLRTYSSALGKYKNQVIQYKPFKLEADSATATVKTEIIQPSGPAIAVDYSLAKTDASWKVFDIVIENVSLVTNYRSQFSTEIRQNGMDSLNKKLADKNKAAGLN
jgi:phospholipid transport system substrate-binding protein